MRSLWRQNFPNKIVPGDAGYFYQVPFAKRFHLAAIVYNDLAVNFGALPTMSPGIRDEAGNILKRSLMRIAFIVWHFPVLSETFILNQVTGLLDLGHEVDIFAFRPPKEIDNALDLCYGF